MIKEYIIYKRDVCEIIERQKDYMNNMDYLVLIPISDNSLKISIPASNEDLKPLITKEEIDNLINKIPEIKIIDCNDKQIENEYKSLMKSYVHEDLIKIIKTSYLRNQKRLNDNKKISDKDDKYFKQAEKYLYSEFSVVLNISYEEAKQYVISHVTKLEE